MTRPRLTPALHTAGSGNLTRRLGALLDPSCPGHFRPRGESESRALDGTGTRETLLPVGLPGGVASSVVVPAAVPCVRQRGQNDTSSKAGRPQSSTPAPLCVLSPPFPLEVWTQLRGGGHGRGGS